MLVSGLDIIHNFKSALVPICYKKFSKPHIENHRLSMLLSLPIHATRPMALLRLLTFWLYLPIVLAIPLRGDEQIGSQYSTLLSAGSAPARSVMHSFSSIHHSNHVPTDEMWSGGESEQMYTSRGLLGSSSMSPKALAEISVYPGTLCLPITDL